MTDGSDATPEQAAATPMLGYFRNFGVRAEPASVKMALEAFFADGTIHWGETEWSEAATDTSMPPEIRKEIHGIKKHGLWYLGGHVYFSEW